MIYISQFVTELRPADNTALCVDLGHLFTSWWDVFVEHLSLFSYKSHLFFLLKRKRLPHCYIGDLASLDGDDAGGYMWYIQHYERFHMLTPHMC